MKKRDGTRYLVLMAVGVLLNFALYEAAHTFHLPLWMDNVGTAYAAVMLEPAAGLIVAFATNFFQSVFVYSSSSLIYYFVSACVALTFGVLLRRQGRLCWRRLPLAGAAFWLVCGVLAWAITLWRTGGVSESGWEGYFCQAALGWGAPAPLAGLFGVLVLKAADMLVTMAALPVLYAATPKWMVTEQLGEQLSWRAPLFVKKEGGMPGGER